MPSVYEEKMPAGTATIYETVRAVAWTDLIEEASRVIDIAVYYVGGWTEQRFEPLVRFLRKPGTKIRLFMPDPDIALNLELMKKLFPRHAGDPATLKAKVALSVEELWNVAKRAGADHNRIEYFPVTRPLTYAAHCFDDRRLVLSFYELSRVGMIESPAVVVDLEQVVALRDFWESERKVLEQSSRHA
jgi:hypothetical protein